MRSIGIFSSKYCFVIDSKKGSLYCATMRTTTCSNIKVVIFHHDIIFITLKISVICISPQIT